MSDRDTPDVIRLRGRSQQISSVNTDGHNNKDSGTTGVFVFENPANGHREELGGSSWLWALLFGWIYLLIKGLVIHVFVWIAIAFAGFLLLGEGGFFVLLILNIFYAANVRSLLRANYLRRGWIELEYGRASDPLKPRDMVGAQSMSVADEIRKLAELKKEGLLTDSEFQAQKKKVLCSNEDPISTQTVVSATSEKTSDRDEDAPEGMSKATKATLWTGLAAIVLVVLAFKGFGAYKDFSENRAEKRKLQATIDLCWQEYMTSTLPIDARLIMAGACDLLEKEYVEKFGKRR